MRNDQGSLIENHPTIATKAFENNSEEEKSPGKLRKDNKGPSFNKYTLTFNNGLEAEYSDLQFYLTINEIRIAFTFTIVVAFLLGLLTVIHFQIYFLYTLFWLGIGIGIPSLITLSFSFSKYGNKQTVGITFWRVQFLIVEFLS